MGHAGVSECQSFLVWQHCHMHIFSMDNIKKDVSLYEEALNTNWPSPGVGEFDESVFDLALSPSPPSIEHGVSPNADKFLMDTNHVLFPELMQVLLTKEDVLAEQKKAQARV